MKRVIYLSFIFLLCNSTTAFVNNSPQEVYVQWGIYPDTLSFYEKFPNPNKEPNLYRVRQGEENTTGLENRNCYEHHRVADNILVVYIFDAEVLTTVPWDTIGKYYMVLKTIRSTLEEMESSNWTIYFTGE